MQQDKVDRVLDYLLKNVAKLKPEKIEALSKVIASLEVVNQAANEPNTIPVAENHEELTENRPMNFSDIQGIEVDGKTIKTKIYEA